MLFRNDVLWCRNFGRCALKACPLTAVYLQPEDKPSAYLGSVAKAMFVGKSPSPPSALFRLHVFSHQRFQLIDDFFADKTVRRNGDRVVGAE